MLNSDYKDILSILSENKVKFLLVGAYAMAVHGYPRATMDIDLSIPDLIINKKVTGRTKDLADVETLEEDL